MPLTDVPIIALGNKYADRDPSLRDNWRGRPRQDISTLQGKIIKVIEIHVSGCLLQPTTASLKKSMHLGIIQM